MSDFFFDGKMQITSSERGPGLDGRNYSTAVSCDGKAIRIFYAVTRTGDRTFFPQNSATVFEVKIIFNPRPVEKKGGEFEVKVN